MEKLIKLSLEQAINLYKNAQHDIKQLLELNFGKSCLINDKTKSISSFEDVLKYFNMKETTESEFNKMLVGCTKKEVAFKKLQLIEKCFNEGKKFANHRYWPYFINEGAGLVFCYSSWGIGASVGAVAVFCTNEDSEYVGKTFTSIYEEFILG